MCSHEFQWKLVQWPSDKRSAVIGFALELMRGFWDGEEGRLIVNRSSVHCSDNSFVTVVWSVNVLPSGSACGNDSNWDTDEHLGEEQVTAIAPSEAFRFSSSGKEKCLIVFGWYRVKPESCSIGIVIFRNY